MFWELLSFLILVVWRFLGSDLVRERSKQVWWTYRKCLHTIWYTTLFKLSHMERLFTKFSRRFQASSDAHLPDKIGDALGYGVKYVQKMTPNGLRENRKLQMNVSVQTVGCTKSCANTSYRSPAPVLTSPWPYLRPVTSKKPKTKPPKLPKVTTSSSD